MKACKEHAEKIKANEALANARRNLENRLAPITAELAQSAKNSLVEFESQEKGRRIMDRQHDMEMSRAAGMTLPQYDTYMNTRDAVILDRDGFYSGADGDTYRIDGNGNKWWYQDGVRGESH